MRIKEDNVGLGEEKCSLLPLDSVIGLRIKLTQDG